MHAPHRLLDLPLGAALLLALSTSCGISLDARYDTAVAPGTDAAGVTIQAITPNYGSIHGGTQVVITATGLEGEVKVFFGNARLDVTPLSATQVQVTTPDAGAALSVDVTVRSDLGEDVWQSGYAFSDSGPVDPGTGGDTGNGLIGGLIELSRTQVACPTCLNMPGEFDVQAGFALHSPTNTSWSASLPPIGSCALNPPSNGPSVTRLDLGQWAYLRSGSTNLPLLRTNATGGVTYLASNLQVNDYISNAAYEIEVPSGGGGVAPFTLTNALRAAEGFDSIGPYELMYGGEAGAFTAQVSGSSQVFTWSPAGAGDDFVVDLGAYDAYTGDYLGHVVCRGNDSGSMVVPTGSYMTPPLLLTVGLYRRKITRTASPIDGSTIEAIATSGFLGTASMDY